MNLVFTPSLHQLAVTKIVTTLWIQDDDIVEDLCFIYRTPLDKRWNKIKNKLTEKIKVMTLPKMLERKILLEIRPVVDEIILWRNFHKRILSWFDARAFKESIRNICWTSQVTVDKKKTAEKWITDEGLDVFKRYELACIYCLENDVPKLSDQLYEINKEYFCYEYIHNFEKSKILFYWTVFLNEEYCVSKRSERSLYRQALRNAVYLRNKVATEYFWGHLAPGKNKARSIGRIKRLAKSCLMDIYKNIREEYLGETLGFLLSQMNDEQQLEAFERQFEGVYGVLKSLLDWPRQSFLLEAAERTWNFLPVLHYRKLLFVDILDKIDVDCADCHYLQIFMEFYKQSPVRCKNYVFCMNPEMVEFFRLCDAEDGEGIRQLLKDAARGEKIERINRGEVTGFRYRSISKYFMNAEIALLSVNA